MLNLEDITASGTRLFLVQGDLWRGLSAVDPDARAWDGGTGRLAAESNMRPGTWAYLDIKITGRTVQHAPGATPAVRCQVTFDDGTVDGAWVALQGGGWPDIAIVRQAIEAATAAV